MSGFRGTEIAVFAHTEERGSRRWLEWSQQTNCSYTTLEWPCSHSSKLTFWRLQSVHTQVCIDSNAKNQQVSQPRQGLLLGPVSSLCYIDNETGDFPKSHLAFAADARATMLGSLLFNASHKLHGIGIACRAGARTGLTAVMCGFMTSF